MIHLDFSSFVLWYNGPIEKGFRKTSLATSEWNGTYIHNKVQHSHAYIPWGGRAPTVFQKIFNWISDFEKIFNSWLGIPSLRASLFVVSSCIQHKTVAKHLLSLSLRNYITLFTFLKVIILNFYQLRQHRFSAQWWTLTPVSSLQCRVMLGLKIAQKGSCCRFRD